MSAIDDIRDPKFKEQLQNYCGWHKSAFGWHPWEDLTCLECKKPVPLISTFRCYDCGAAMHRDCLRHHCKIEGTDNRSPGEHHG